MSWRRDLNDAARKKIWLALKQTSDLKWNMFSDYEICGIISELIDDIEKHIKTPPALFIGRRKKPSHLKGDNLE